MISTGSKIRDSERDGSRITDSQRKDVEEIATKVADKVVQQNNDRFGVGQVKDVELPDADTFGPLVRFVNPGLGIHADIVGDTLNISGTPVDNESQKAFGYVIEGIKVRVYRGAISTIQGLYHFTENVTSDIVGTSVCVFIYCDRVAMTPTLAWSGEPVGQEGFGLPHTDKEFVFPIVSLGVSETNLTLVRRHHMGGMIHAIAPAM